MSSTFGACLKLSVFGQSHGEAIGMVLDGLPAGEAVDLDELQAFLERRAPGRSPWATKRNEPDKLIVKAGLLNGKTCGAPLMMLIENTDMHSGDYAGFADSPRPSHADYPASVRFGAPLDLRGGGHYSGRLTAALCMAGGVCKQLLSRRKIEIGAHILQIGGAEDTRFDPVGLDSGTLLTPGKKPFPVLSDAAGIAMQQEVEEARAAADSIGGIVEIGAIGLPVGIGEPLFGGVENKLSAAMFAVGAVRGISFGDGFAAAKMRGSAHNDPYCIQNGEIRTKTNHAGGVLGGMTTGMPLVFQVAFKPTPSIGQPQQTVSLTERAETTLVIKGRHDPCIVPRAVPVTEAVTALCLADLLAEAGQR